MFVSPLPTRRQALRDTACGFGYLALAGLSANHAAAAPGNPLAVRPPHFAARAKRVIFLFMQGGVSQVDSFDYKPRLDKRRRQDAQVRRCPPAGQHGRWADSSQRVMKPLVEVFPARRVRPLGLDSFPRDQPARRRPLLHPLACTPKASPTARRRCSCTAASTNFIRPSMGSWVALRPGHREREPARLRLDRPVGGQRRAAQLRQRLPARRLPGHARSAGPAAAASEATIRNLTNPQLSPTAQRRQLDLLQAINAEQLQADAPATPNWKRSIDSYELAWRMQSNAPDILDLSSETADDAGSSTASATRRPTTSAGSA